MKKFLVALVLVVCSASFVSADINDTLDTIWTEKEQARAAFTARAILQDTTNDVTEGLAMIQEIVDAGQFDAIPADLKVALNRWWIIFKDARTAFQADSELGDIYQWQP